MISKWDQKLNILKSIVSKMNEYGDNLNKIVEKLEDDLIMIGTGVPAEVGEPTEILVSYQRFGSSFKICVSTDTMAVKPWRECNRALKYESFFMIDSLLDVIIKNSEEQLNILQKVE